MVNFVKNSEYYFVYAIKAADGYAGKSRVAAETVEEANTYIQQFRDSNDSIDAAGYQDVSECDKLEHVLSCKKGIIDYGIHVETEKDARFINDDVKLKVGGRKAAPITKERLGRMILETARNNPNEMVRDVLSTLDEKWYEYCDGSQFLQICTSLTEDKSLQKDNKFHACAENVVGHKYYPSHTEIGKPLMGMHTLDNGLTFFGFAVGGDWELPVYMIVYFDGKKLRLYTPSYGNLVNLDFKSALGSEDTDCKNIDKIIKKYEKLGVYPEDEDDFFDRPAVTYLAQYGIDEDGFDCGEANYNWDAIKQDIEARIEVV
jgi:hypothetical protein